MTMLFNVGDSPTWAILPTRGTRPERTYLKELAVLSQECTCGFQGWCSAGACTGHSLGRGVCVDYRCSADPTNRPESHTGTSTNPAYPMRGLCGHFHADFQMISVPPDRRSVAQLSVCTIDNSAASGFQSYQHPR